MRTVTIPVEAMIDTCNPPHLLRWEVLMPRLESDEVVLDLDTDAYVPLDRETRDAVMPSLIDAMATAQTEAEGRCPLYAPTVSLHAVEEVMNAVLTNYAIPSETLAEMVGDVLGTLEDSQ